MSGENIKPNTTEVSTKQNPTGNMGKVALGSATSSTTVGSTAQDDLQDDLQDELRDVLQNNLQNKIRSEIEKYEKDENFEDRISSWLSVGVSSTLASGKFDETIKESWARKGLPVDMGIVNTDSSLTQRGFAELETPRIKKSFGVQDDSYYNEINAVNTVKNELRRDIDDIIGLLSPEMLNNAKKTGVVYNISEGARILSDKFGDSLQFMIPVDKTEEARGFMTKMGVDFDSLKDDPETVKASYSGFANIIGAISEFQNEKAQKDGAKLLNWYFDTFHYKDHMDDFVGEMIDIYDAENSSWKKTFDEFRGAREEFVDFYKAKSKIPDMTFSNELTEDQFYEMMKNGVPYRTSSAEAAIFQKPEREHALEGLNSGTKRAKANIIPGEQKRNKLIEEYKGLKSIDKDTTVYYIKFKNSTGKTIDYIGLRYGVHNKNVIIAAPIQEKSSDAAYVCVCETGDDRDGWQKYFKNSGSYSKQNEARENGTILAHSHKPNKKYGLDGLQNMWYNIWKDIDSRTRS